MIDVRALLNETTKQLGIGDDVKPLMVVELAVPGLDGSGLLRPGQKATCVGVESLSDADWRRARAGRLSIALVPPKAAQMRFASKAAQARDEECARFGTEVRVLSVGRGPDGTTSLSVVGARWIEILSAQRRGDCVRAIVKPLDWGTRTLAQAGTLEPCEAGAFDRAPSWAGNR